MDAVEQINECWITQFGANLGNFLELRFFLVLCKLEFNDFGAIWLLQSVDWKRGGVLPFCNFDTRAGYWGVASVAVDAFDLWRFKLVKDANLPY